jgi:FAD:protein FMN transferase
MPDRKLTARQLLFTLIAAAVLLYLVLRPPHDGSGDPRFIQHEFFAMGTWITLSAYLDDGSQREAALSALHAAEDRLRRHQQRWTPWGDGALAKVNQALQAGERVPLTAELAPLFVRADWMRQASGGAFDARVGALVRTWGFDREEHFRSAPPPRAELDTALAALQAAPPSPLPCEDPSAICYGPAPGVVWDFGAIAKGTGLKDAAEVLRDAGIGHYIVNGGGDLVVAGRRGERAWRVAIRHPRAQYGRLLATLESENEAVFTSGDYERFFEHQGRRYHHILDPRSGEPAMGLQSVTVIHDDVALADAASTALFVAGPDGWRETARALGVDQVMVVHADGRIEMTAALEPRLRFPGDPPRSVVP